MSQATLSADQLIGGRQASDEELSTRWDRYLNKLNGMRTKQLSRDEYARFKSEGVASFDPTPANAYDVMVQALGANPHLAKGLDANSLASIKATLESMKASAPDLTKDFNLTSPIPSGAVAFDLEAPMKELAPRPTPIRNRMPRERGIGTSHRFKTITGFTGSGTGGVGVVHPGIVDTTQNNFAVSGSSNALYYNRGPKISYAGIDTVVPYMQFSLSDEVTWSAQYSGRSDFALAA